MIGIILCAGKGSRILNLMSPNKCLLKFQDTSLLEKAISYLNELPEITKIIIVVNYNKQEVIEEAKRSAKKELLLVEQKNLNGIIGAIEQCISLICDDDFMLLLGDEYYVMPRYRDFISYFISSKLSILVGVVCVDAVSRIIKTYGITRIDDKLAYFEEKPENSINNIMGTGAILFKNSILEYLDKVKVNKKRNERDLVDLLNLALEGNKKVQIFEISKNYFNINDNEEIENLNTYLIYMEKEIKEGQNG